MFALRGRAVLSHPLTSSETCVGQISPIDSTSQSARATLTHETDMHALREGQAWKLRGAGVAMGSLGMRGVGGGGQRGLGEEKLTFIDFKTRPVPSLPAPLIVWTELCGVSAKT